MQKILVSVEQFNDMIADYDGYRIFLEGKDYKLTSHMRAYIDEGRAWATLTIKTGKNAKEYKCPLCEDPDLSDFFTEIANQQLGRWVKPFVHELDNGKEVLPDGPNFAYYNRKYEKKRLKIWAYDVNSAYLYATLGNWPDTRFSLGPGYLGENEIGFNKIWLTEGYNKTERLVAIFEPGEYCEFRFKEMPCPEKVREWVLKNYQKKKNAKTKAEKTKYKHFLVCLAGCLRNWNTFVRSTFLTRSKNYVESFFDENTVYANVDCIYSLTPRPDLPIGKEIGMFKEEISGEDFAFNGAIHGTNKEPRWSGVPRSWFKGQDFVDCVIKDRIPPNTNLYKLDKNTCLIVRRENND